MVKTPTLIGAISGLLLVWAGLHYQNDIVLGTALSIVVGATGYGLVAGRRPH